jgi:hypothetical protein
MADDMSLAGEQRSFWDILLATAVILSQAWLIVRRREQCSLTPATDPMRRMRRVNIS